MKKKVSLFAFIVWITALNAQQKVTLSLDEAIQFAAKNQPAFQNYRIDKEIAGAKKLESTSKYLPKLNGSVDLRDNLKLGQVVLRFPNPVTNVEEERTIQQGTKYSATAGVDLVQPIIDMGAVTDIRYSGQQQILSELQYQQAMIDLKVNITRSYYLVLLNEERVAKAQKSLSRFQRVYEDTKVKYENQSALRTDMNRAFLNLANSKFQLKVAEDSVKTSRSSLRQLIGLPSDTELSLSDALPDEVKAEAIPEYPDLSSIASSRIEMKAERMQETLNKLQLKKINMQYVPTLNGYGYIGGQGLDNNNIVRRDSWYWNSYIGLRLSVPIFDGLQKTSMAHQQRLMIRKNENNLMTIRNNISYQLQTASVNYVNAVSNLELIKENVKLAEEVVRDVNTRYLNSLATFQELLDAENTLKETEFIYLQSLYTFLLAELEWKKANGSL